MKNAIVIFVIALLVLVFFLPSFSKKQDLLKRNQDLKKQIEDLTQKNIDLLKEQKLLEEDPEYLEKVAREKMGLVKEGEVIYRIIPSSSE
ncbi:hypothetical protein MNBD_BACTEROID05-1225 [hydrothermal vent metagenome]|uniref:Cell division protein DivIC (FtsB), stabilizes FtsL against RasP cleavage n=1 Tax=hydrothermal vent metagenome TaxID=652676 RepID=A0A3B0T7L6_9ZZZZ